MNVQKNRPSYIFIATVYVTIALLVKPCIADYHRMDYGAVETSKKHDEDIEKKCNKERFQQNNQDYFSENTLRYSDYVYSNSIRTVLFNKNGTDFSMPVLELGSSEKLVLRFDDVESSLRNFSYTILHCNPSWEPSPLEPFEYIEGFPMQEILDYKYSFNTQVSYVHYKVEFPNEQLTPKLSGNYLLIVYEDNDPEKLVLTRRFFVYEQKVGVDAKVSMAALIDDQKYKQEIDFSITAFNSYYLSNPFEDVKVVVRQNGRWDNAITGLKPSLVRGNTLVYEYEDGNIFDGGNEYRGIDLKNLKFVSGRMGRLVNTDRGWEACLMPDERRTFKRFVSMDDINGRYLVKNDEATDYHTESDYVWVYFSLPYSPILTDGSVYVFGGLSDWGFPLTHRMTYNFKKSAYEAKILLKQGYYNYVYMFLENGFQQGDISFLEGNHSETGNEYTIMVYHKAPGDLHFSLIGFTHASSF